MHLAEEEYVKKGAAKMHTFRESFVVKEVALFRPYNRNLSRDFVVIFLWSLACFRGDIAAVINVKFIMDVNS